MSNRCFVLLGGGELKTKETLALDRRIAEFAKPAGEERPCALFLGTASHDFMPYYNTFHKTYTGELGWKTDVALTVFHQPEPEKLDAKFAKANLIYVGGGDTLFLMEHWKEDGLYERVLDAYRRGVVIAGLSAGAICWFEEMYTDSAKTEGGKYAFEEGMGLLFGGACPHYDHRREDFAAALPEGGEWLCMEDNAAAVFENEKLIGCWQNGGKVYKVQKREGKITETEVDQI